MRGFDTHEEAEEYIGTRVDVPALTRVEDLGGGMSLAVSSQELDDGKFTNILDLSFPAKDVRPSIEFHSKLTSVYDYVKGRSDIRAATSAGFFFLADKASSAPRQLGLNLALTGGKVHNFPVTDQEALLVRDKRLTAEYVKALGIVVVNKTALSWSGSLTPHETDIKVFGNGNCIIHHVRNDVTGSIRMLEESSRYTPSIDRGDTVDVGFVRRKDGSFDGVSTSETGHLDIFSYDVVMRIPERYVYGTLPKMRVKTVGTKAIDGLLRSAVSVGPMLDSDNFADHPINRDASLGDRPPFLDVPLARTALYETDNGIIHLRLFDGRPGSPVFPGVTPNQAVTSIASEERVTWGCFLDPGQSAKLVVRNMEDIESDGNNHYSKWPKKPGKKIVLKPKVGRKVASTVAFR